MVFVNGFYYLHNNVVCMPFLVRVRYAYVFHRLHNRGNERSDVGTRRAKTVIIHLIRSVGNRNVSDTGGRQVRVSRRWK
ncbi:hypothetical protein QQG55_42085 [Brugia pahangi]